MNPLYPITFAFRTFNTAATAYMCGKIGLSAYKQVRVMQKEKQNAAELRARFVAEYMTNHDGEEPSEELISTVLSAYDAVEKPLLHRGKKLVDDIGKKVAYCVEGKWLEDLARSQEPKVPVTVADEEED